MTADGFGVPTHGVFKSYTRYVLHITMPCSVCHLYSETRNTQAVTQVSAIGNAKMHKCYFVVATVMAIAKANSM